MSNYIELSNGSKLPTVGLGTWLAKPGQVETAVIDAITAGFRHIDCAYGYGNEKEVGSALSQVFKEGIVAREDLFIVSKLWNTKHHAEDVKPSLQESLSSLGLEYLDLYLIHWPHAFKAGADLFPKDELGNLIYDDVHYLETWKALESCVEEGLVKAIGLSNFNSQQIQDVINNSKIKPAVLQVEVNPYFQQEKLVAFCHQRGLAVTAYSGFGSPARPWADPSEASILDNPQIVAIAAEHNKSAAQVVLRWLIQRRISVIPKSVTKSRIIDNFQVFDFELTSAEMERMRALDKNIRSIAPLVERNGVKEFRDKDAPNFPYLIDF